MGRVQNRKPRDLTKDNRTGQPPDSTVIPTVSPWVPPLPKPKVLSSDIDTFPPGYSPGKPQKGVRGEGCGSVDESVDDSRGHLRSQEGRD